MAMIAEIQASLGVAEDYPALVFWKSQLDIDDNRCLWIELEGHDCGGFSINEFRGFVVGLRPNREAVPVLRAIADEAFCDERNLDYGCTDAHREAYVAFLKENGLQCSGLELLQQAVYPLAASRENLDMFGVEYNDEIPQGALLIVLGENCD